MTVLVSIVMPTLNQSAYIQESTKSILSQSYENIELVVADGGSTDGTQSLLTSISYDDNRVSWISRPDSGPASALNSALNRARGTIIGWLNSDDIYADNAIQQAVNLFETHSEWIMLYGQGEHVDATGHTIAAYQTHQPNTESITKFKNGCFICQPTVFFRSPMKLLLGNFDETLKAAFDFDYWIRAFKAFPNRIGFVDTLLAKSRLHETCITLMQRRQVYMESMSVITKHLGDPPSHWLISYADELRSKQTALSTQEIQSELYQMIKTLHPQPTDIGLNRLRWVIEHYV